MKMKFHTIFMLHIFIIMLSFIMLGFILESVVDMFSAEGSTVGNTLLIVNIIAVLLIGAGAGTLYNLIYTWNNAPRILLFPHKYTGQSDAKSDAQFGAQYDASSTSIDRKKILHGILLGMGMVLLVWASELISGKEIGVGIIQRSLFYTMYMILPSFFEEILFRGGILHIFYAMGKSKVGLIVSGVLFGATHIINLVQNQSVVFTDIIWVVNIMIMGIVLGYFYIRFGLVVVIGVHWFWNAFFGANMQVVETSLSTTILPMMLICIYEMAVHRKKL